MIRLILAAFVVAFLATLLVAGYRTRNERPPREVCPTCRSRRCAGLRLAGAR